MSSLHGVPGVPRGWTFFTNLIKAGFCRCPLDFPSQGIILGK
jgi:hypothetical protein